MTNIQQLIKDNHIKLEHQEIDEDIPEDEQLPLQPSPERGGGDVGGDNMSDDGADEIRDETEATGQSPKGNLSIEEDIIPDFTDNTVTPNAGTTTKITTEKLVNHVMEANIQD